ncbi:MAG: hypothetical protein PHS31_05855 [Victivallaceae bacterium]|nr:hypothetical protein [Victivallaceae bacterium]MDD4180445.1 hypothetical protein [Victivallaceae bacterium]
MRCSACGSSEVTVNSRKYNPVVGCLGFLLFSWWGLLLGLFFNDLQASCNECGHREPLNTQSSSCCGCLVLLFLLAIVFMLFFN